MSDGICVLPKDCGCITDAGATVPDGFIQVDCDRKCTCDNNEYKCIQHAEDECIHGIGCPCEREFVFACLKTRFLMPGKNKVGAP